MSPLISYAWVQSVFIRAEIGMESEIDAIDQTAPSVSPNTKVNAWVIVWIFHEFIYVTTIF